MNPQHNSHQPQEAVDRILNGLRDASPLAGMEQRILNTLETHSSTTSFRAKRGTPAFRDARTRNSLRWAAIAAVATIVVTISLRTQHHTSSKTPQTAAQTTTTPQREVSAPTPTALVKVTQAHAPRTSGTLKQITEPRIEIAQTDSAQVSHPAPPIPLTTQEQLLLRYARRGRTEDLAQISTDRKAAKEDQEAAAFQAFFTPPVLIGESE